MTDNDPKTLRAENDTLREEMQQLIAFKNLILMTGTILDLNALLNELVTKTVDIIACERAVIFIHNEEDADLNFGAINTISLAPPDEATLKSLSISVFNAEDDPMIGAWLRGEAFGLNEKQIDSNPALKWMRDMIGFNEVFGIPLVMKGHLLGLLLIEGPISEAVQNNLLELAEAASITLENARVYSETVEKSAASMRELYILRQIDRELNDNIELSHVFNMTLDWALRFTSSQAVSVELYDEHTDEMRLMAHYGHDTTIDPELTLRLQRGGIAHRVARSGHPEIIPDVSMDKDFVRVSSVTNSQMCVPVIREDRVIAVITVASRKLNGFTDEHLDFVEKLAARAAVAIDNARLFYETKREREKLSHILNNTADIVIVCSLDDRIILINPAAYAALKMTSGETYIGQSVYDIFVDTNLMEIYRRARASGEPAVAEAVLPNNRTFHINMTSQEDVGWIIVMHDITPYKEMDRLKSELIATVSHDLKQPLSVMNGYTELLLMHKKFDVTGINFVEMVRKSITNMRQLIDDILDLAKIESGIKLDLQEIYLNVLVNDCIESLQPNILNKNLIVTMEIPDNVPAVWADRGRLQQILSNLIGNAVKYTPADGWVKVRAEMRDTMVRITIQDNGLGISPEDQVHIFDRFYRVRRPETDSIEGTGLGLAIVKSLVEAHNGQIGLESRLGEGTTFYLLLPVHLQENPELPSPA